MTPSARLSTVSLPRHQRLWGLAVLIAVAIVGFGVLGTLYVEGDRLFGRGLYPFNLDAEGNAPAIFSFLLLVGAAAAGAKALGWWGEGRDAIAAARPALATITAFFLFMSLDELLGFHEQLESTTGVDWQILYVPVAAAGGVAWLSCMRGIRAGARWLWLAGAAAWLVAQLLEYLQWDGDRLIHPLMIPPEEMLEMAGSAAFMFALLLVADSSKRRS